MRFSAERALTTLRVLLMAAMFMATACGSSEESEAKEKKENLAKAVSLSMVGKTLLVEDNLYTGSCNQFFFDFLSTASATCKQGKARTDFDGGWSIKSTDEVISISATEYADKEVLKIGDSDYYCYLYSGSVFMPDGEQKFGGSHVILSKSVATKPSDLNAADVYLLANIDGELCEALH